MKNTSNPARPSGSRGHWIRSEVFWSWTSSRVGGEGLKFAWKGKCVVWATLVLQLKYSSFRASASSILAE